MLNIRTLAERINKLSSSHVVGGLQALRRERLGKIPRSKRIFSKSTIKDKIAEPYAYHDGGRTELQFNIGLEIRGKKRMWRHGVAFEFQRDQTLQDFKALRPSVQRFNEWVTSNPDLLGDFRMWQWGKSAKGRSEDRPPGQVLEESMEKEEFVFLGKMVPEGSVDATEILKDFDRLSPLYKHCLGAASSNPAGIPGKLKRSLGLKTYTTASLPGGEIDVDLRHKQLQGLVAPILESEFPGCPVHFEYPVAMGCSVDLAVEAPDGFLFCEIKVAPSVREALRPAIGQLMEYVHWPNELRANRWWVMAEKDPSADDRSYLNALRSKYDLPLFYRRIDAEGESLGPET